MQQEELQRIKEQTRSWWYCENIVNHPDQVGFLRMDFPQVFILLRHVDEDYFCDFEAFKTRVAEINFFNPRDRQNADIDAILTEAWNFWALTEEEEDRLYEENDRYMEDDT